MKKCTSLLLLMVSLLLVSCKGQDAVASNSKLKEVTIKVDSSMQVDPDLLKLPSSILPKFDDTFSSSYDVKSIFRNQNGCDDFTRLLEDKIQNGEKFSNPLSDQKKIIFEPYCENIEVKTLVKEEKEEAALDEIKEIEDETQFHTSEFSKTLYSTSEFFVSSNPCAESLTNFLIYKSSPITVSGISDNGWYEINFKGRKFYAPVENFSATDDITEGREFKVSNSYSYLYDDGLGGKCLSVVESTLDCSPMEVKNILEEDGWKIYLTNRDIGDMFDYHNTHICAFTLFDRKEIWISRSACNTHMISHELGHLYDGANYNLSGDKDFFLAFDAEMNNLSIFDNTSLDNYNTPDEYFAECYSMFMTKRYELSKYCPYSYEYMQNLFDDSELV